MRLSRTARVFLIDTLAMALLTSVPAGIVEFFFLGLPAENVLGVRAFAAFTSLVTGGLYGRWRDACVRRFTRAQDTRLRRMLADMAANMAATVILYPIQLLLFGATRMQVVSGVAVALLACVAVGPITGVVLELARAGFKRHAVMRLLRPTHISAVEDAPDRAA